MYNPAILWSLGGAEIFLILFIILLLFGAKRIPELAKGLGKGIKEFREANSEKPEDKDKDNKQKD